jgi:hypothetical protein
MILISHRGNVNGRIIEAENNPEYIEDTIRLGYDVEIDMWWIDGTTFLGHDYPQYKVDNTWLQKRMDKLWIHCKNTDIFIWIKNTSLHYFWHEKDTVTLTSKGFIWAYPGKQPIKNSIAVLPELNNDMINDCLGICSDFVEKYKNINYGI